MRERAPEGGGLLRPRRRSVASWFLAAALVGLLSGAAACIFQGVLAAGEELLLRDLAGVAVVRPQGERTGSPSPGVPFSRVAFFLLPIAGGLLSGLLVCRFAPEAEGHGTDAMIDAFHNKGGAIRGRVPLVKGLASVLTLASGGSAGREGPIAQIGAGVGSWLGGLLRLDPHDRRILLLAGAAAGIGAIFRAPLGGALTAIEVLYREDQESEALVPATVAAVTAYLVFTGVYGRATIFALPRGVGFDAPVELVSHALLGLLCAPVGWLFVKAFYGLRDRVFKPLDLPRPLKPALGGLCVALVGLLLPGVYGTGWGTLQQAFYGKVALGTMAALAVGKVLATSCTVGSGGSGGVFGPALFIGGMLGGAFGTALHAVAPALVGLPAEYVLVGMAAFFAAVASAPLGSILMICEMTGGYALLPPLLVAVTVAVAFSRNSIYEKQVRDRFDSPAHLGDLTVDVLADLTVADALRPGCSAAAVTPGTSLGELRRRLAGESPDGFVVVDGGELRGWVPVEAVRVVLDEEGLEDVVIAQDLMFEPVLVARDADLHAALVRMLDSGSQQLVVLDPAAPAGVAGLLRHQDIDAAYHGAVLVRRQEPRARG